VTQSPGEQSRSEAGRARHGRERDDVRGPQGTPDVSPEVDASVNVEQLVRRWETASRAYVAEVTRDLFGELILRCTNAGIGKRHYRERTTACGEPAIRRALDELGRVRRARAYTVVAGDGDRPA
jgi:hypothetical protein